MGFKRIVFVRLLCPVMISSEEEDTARRFARNLMHILLAAPSTGGAAILTLRLSACKPTIIFLEDRGRTKTLNMMP